MLKTTAVEDIVRAVVRLQVTARTPGGGMSCMLCSSPNPLAQHPSASHLGLDLHNRRQPAVPALARDLRTGRAGSGHSELRAASRRAAACRAAVERSLLAIAKGRARLRLFKLSVNLVSAARRSPCQRLRRKRRRLPHALGGFGVRRSNGSRSALIPVGIAKHQRALGGCRAGQHAPRQATLADDPTRAVDGGSTGCMLLQGGSEICPAKEARAGPRVQDVQRKRASDEREGSWWQWSQRIAPIHRCERPGHWCCVVPRSTSMCSVPGPLSALAAQSG